MLVSQLHSVAFEIPLFTYLYIFFHFQHDTMNLFFLSTLTLSLHLHLYYTPLNLDHEFAIAFDSQIMDPQLLQHPILDFVFVKSLLLIFSRYVSRYCVLIEFGV